MNGLSFAAPRLIGTLLAAGVVVACSLDTVGEAPALDSIVGVGDPDQGHADSGTSAGDASRETSPVDATSADAPSVMPDAESADCDQDHDGVRAIACGGADCCDTDPRVFPGTKQYWSVASKCGTFDYDCDGKETVEYGVKDCRAVKSMCIGNGFEIAAACGISADYAMCNDSLLGICDESKSTKQQRCR